ncbi:cell division topological specificity factor MinE [Parendozoicomonas haliclonae]|uniref:Cell division topological specificity factor n=1 Tax=Parendozoicomonas haliclonae TaxID=1960125 RepID=A0A1X7AQN9_9GAMM|nr:cell division topological specificity factor MinE [Parendozoicomonas haliclonae]SMA50409.1 Cell division topological specificity factor [Parendozoicomonas haliclonae]
MSLLEVFRSKQKKNEHNSAAIARERLQIIVTHERAGNNTPDYIPSMKQDILEVVRKYVSVSEEHVSITFESQKDVSILELNVTLPENCSVGAP